MSTVPTEEIETIERILKMGSASAVSILALMLDFGFERKRIQIAMQIGLERGTFGLDSNMHIAIAKDNPDVTTGWT